MKMVLLTRRSYLLATLTSIMLLLAFNLFLLIPHTLILATQVSNADTNLVNAVQEAAQNGTEYLRAKISINGLQLSAEIPTTRELMAKGLAVKNELSLLLLFILYSSSLPSQSYKCDICGMVFLFF